MTVIGAIRHLFLGHSRSGVNGYTPMARRVAFANGCLFGVFSILFSGIQSIVILLVTF